MKKTGIILTVVASIVLVGTLIFWGWNKFSEFDHEIRGFIDQSVPVIFTEWKKEELIKYSSPEMVKYIAEHDAETDTLLKGFSEKYGPLKNYKGARLVDKMNVKVNMKGGRYITESYCAEAEYEKGTALFQLRIVKDGGQWRYLRFDVE